MLDGNTQGDAWHGLRENLRFRMGLGGSGGLSKGLRALEGVGLRGLPGFKGLGS